MVQAAVTGANGVRIAAGGPVGTRFALPEGAVVTLPDSAGT